MPPNGLPLLFRRVIVSRTQLVYRHICSLLTLDARSTDRLMGRFHT